MAQERKWPPGWREKAFNEWHRAESISRFVSPAVAHTMAAIDIDLVEIMHRDYRPLILHETVQDEGQGSKQTRGLELLAKRSRVPALLTLYTLADTPNPARPEAPDISSFRSAWVYPKKTDFVRRTPAEYARFLLDARKHAETTLYGAIP